jgi:hypothetical protein
LPINMAHTIGTLALLGMLIVVSASFAMVTNSLEGEVTKEQLSAVGEYIALHIVEMATLVDTSNLDYNDTGRIMIRNITLPPAIQGKVYIIEIVNGTSNQCFVRLSMLTRPDISVEVPIPLSQVSQRIVLTTRLLPSLNRTDRLYSGEEFRFAIWGYRNGSLSVGLARWEKTVP